MRLGLRLFFGFFVVTGLTAFVLLRVFLGEVKPSVREVMEDVMVDTANLVAELVQDDLAAMPAGGDLRDSRSAARLHDYTQRSIDATIWGLHKRSLDLRIVVTDLQGRVVLDSASPPALGQDYSAWRDIARTLRGDYGARSSRSIAGDDRSTVLVVAAPVRRNGRLMGVVSVSKPLAEVQQFIDRAERRIWLAGIFLLTFSLIVGVAVTLWLVFSVRRLRHYALHVQTGKPLALPQLPGELGELAQAMDSMRQRLDGREHIEHMVRALTHELKSPLAALRGAGEFLQDELAPADRQRFAAQVLQQSERMRELVDRMLELSKLEMQAVPAHTERLNLLTEVDAALQAQRGRLAQRGMRVQRLASESLQVTADPELLQLAFSNLLANAIDFAGMGTALDVSVRAERPQALFILRDYGPGVPAAAWPQLGQRFFSTARPGSLSKGSGLGLAIVRQLASMHGGSLEFEAAEPGLRVIFKLPLT